MHEGNVVYWDGFLDLDLERSHATAVTRIPPSAIREYCRVQDFEPGFAADFEDIIKMVDVEHCKSLMDERKKKESQ